MARLKNTLVTAEDVLRCDSPYRDCELWDGAALVREPSGGEAEYVAAQVIAPLGVHVQGQGLGWTFLSSQGFLLARDPDRLLAPDGAYVSRKRLPRLPKRGFIEVAPDFLIEVRSPDDTWEGVVEKCGVWIAHGVRCAWAIDPFRRALCELRPAQHPVNHLDGKGIARASPALPAFSIPLATLFAGIE